MNYPMMVDLIARPVLIIGAGKVACRKCRDLVESGAVITVVAPRGEDDFFKWEAEGKLIWKKRFYENGDLGGQEFVFAALNDEEMTERIVASALKLGLWVNSADHRFPGNFMVPAKYRQGELLFTVSTGGQSPGLAKQVRSDLEERYGEVWAQYLELVARLREELSEQGTPKERTAFWRQVLDKELLNWVHQGRLEEVEAKIRNAARDIGGKSS